MKTLGKLLTHLGRYKKLLFISLFCIFASVFIGLINPIVLRRAVDGLHVQLSWRKLTLYTFVILGLTLVSSLFSLLSRYSVNFLSGRIVCDLRFEFYAHLQKQSLYFFQRSRTSELMVRATSELEAVHQLVGQVMIYTVQIAVTFALLLPLMLRISQRLTLLFFTTLPLAFVTIYCFNKNSMKRARKTQGCLMQLLQCAEENLKGVRVVRAYSQEKTEIAAFTALTLKHKSATRELMQLNAINAPLLQFLIGISYVINLWYAITLATRGTISLGQFIEFNAYVMFLIWPLSSFGQTLKQYQLGMLTLQGIDALLAQEPVVKDLEGVREQPPIRGRIEFRNLTLAYNEAAEPVLHDINLVIEEGQTVALIGPTGSGKSTLVNLIPRLLEAPQGTVLIDNVPVANYPLAQLRASISYVPQETLLFSDSLAENIAFGVESASPAEIAHAADAAGLMDDVRNFPAGFETLVGERGVLLSGGQKQRTALARALLRRPRILILDDALSAVDAFTAEQVMKGLRVAMKGRTALIISNRIAIAREADLICIFNQGRIVQRGTHQELLEQSAEYASLYYREMLESELVA
jgi:ATP-binding cassette subfamily B protein